MKYIWVAEYKKDRKWHYIGADPKQLGAEKLCHEAREHKFFSSARTRRYEFISKPKKIKKLDSIRCVGCGEDFTCKSYCPISYPKK